MVSLTFRSHPAARDTCSFLQLLASIIAYLKTNEQSSGLLRDRILSLLHLWCAAFDETEPLNQLLFSLNLKEMMLDSDADHTDASHSNDCDYSKLKVASLSSLVTIFTTWKPSLDTGTAQIVLLVWRFGLSCFDIKSPADYKIGNSCLLSDESQTPVRQLSLLRWFRKCLVRDRTLQDRIVRESPASEVKVVLQLYQAGLLSDRTDLLERGGSQKNPRFAVVTELNMICLVLFAAVQRIKRESDRQTSSPLVVCQLVSQEPYAKFISEGLEKVILPLLPDPASDVDEKSFQHQGKFKVLLKVKIPVKFC